MGGGRARGSPDYPSQVTFGPIKSHQSPVGPQANVDQDENAKRHPKHIHHRCQEEEP